MKNIIIEENSRLEHKVLANLNFKTFDLGHKKFDVHFFNADLCTQVIQKRYGFLIMNLVTGKRTMKKGFDHDYLIEVMNELGIKI